MRAETFPSRHSISGLEEATLVFGNSILVAALKRAAGVRMTPSPALGRQTSSLPGEESEAMAPGANRLGEGGAGSNCGPGAFGFPGQPFSGASWDGGGVGAGGAGPRSPRGGGAGAEGVGKSSRPVLPLRR